MGQPSLNGPCPCGSGKKFKRCCGAGGKPAGQPDRQEGPRQLVAAAVAAYERGDMPNADRLIGQALASAPNDPGLLGIKGMVALQCGALDEASAHIERAIAINPDDSRLRNFLGQVLNKRQDNARRTLAERAFGQAVSLDPGFVEAWYNLGQVQLAMAKPYEAIQSFSQALRRAPEDGDLLIQLAKAHYLMGELGPAGHAIARALACGAGPLLANLWRSLVVRAEGREEEADAIEADVLDRAPASSEIYPLLLEFGQTETDAGHLTEAERWLRRAIAMNPDDDAPYFNLATAHKFTEADRDLIGRMNDLLVGNPRADRRRLEFALGKACSDLGEYDLAFAHYQTGNDLVRARVPYDAAAEEAQVDAIIESASAERLAALAPGSDSDLPVLIVGTPRSGTTLTEQIISSHSQAAGAGEMDFWMRVGPGLMAAYTPELATRLAEDYLALMRRHSASARRITDKQPVNYMQIGAIHAVFPKARIVHCRRHPIDACLSIYFQNFDDSQSYKWDLDSLVTFYEQYQRFMAHWRATLPPGTLYELQYESLVDDIEGESRKLMDFLGLDWEPGQLDFHKQQRSVFTASKWQARQPIYKTSKDRWRRYEKHLGPLLELLKYAN